MWLSSWPTTVMYSSQQAADELRRRSTGASLTGSVRPQPGQALERGSIEAGSVGCDLGSTGVRALDGAHVDLLVAIGHALRREPIDDALADLLAVERIDAVDQEGEMHHVVAEEPVHSLADDFRQRPDSAAEHRRARGEGFDHH